MPAIVKSIIPAALAYAGVRVAQTFVPGAGALIQAAGGVAGAFGGLYIAKKFA